MISACSANHCITCAHAGWVAVHDADKLNHIDAKLATLWGLGATAQFLQGEQLRQKLGTSHYQAAIWCGNAIHLSSVLQVHPHLWRGGLPPRHRFLAHLKIFLSEQHCDITGLERMGNGSIRANGHDASIVAKQVRVGLDVSATVPMELSASLIYFAS
ncbi:MULTISPECIES: hypothetical protein [unclassified Pseudomonas]|uniref:hypothetical protein n=1 Tax=unclassified Pseudomonas TaxID=196821 RepID=UPI0011EFA265|nr:MULTISPECIES: hypothetical protein [unclassified Pseudomonas]KAA0944820.1 hypothetical protein FQ182_20530 [Pseudomonas sp. ANT_H4]KAA0952650.1 hypothetical protein FQ186_09920 [Pseudomonas sp. ANT_H14]